LPEVNKNYQKADVIAKLFGKTTRRIQQLTQDGVLPTEETPSGRRYDLIPTIKNYIKYLEDRLEKQRPKSMEDKLEKKLDAEIKYKKAKADKAKLELAEANAIMYRAEDIEKLTNELVFSIKGMLLALPGRVAMDLANIDNAPEVSKYMAQHVNGLLTELANHEYSPERYKQLIREREGWLLNTDNDDGDDFEQEI